MPQRTSSLASLLVLSAATMNTACSSSSPASSGGDAGEGGACVSGQFEWATSGGGAGQGDSVTGVAVDKDGNAWVTGTFIGSATWGSFTLSSADTTHTTAFVAKLGPSGQVLFARAIEGGSGGITNTSESGSRVRVDANGDAYVVGGYSQQLDVDGVHLMETNTGNGSAFLLKLDHATGQAIWGATSSNGGDGERANDLTIDANGDVYVVGEYNGTVMFGSSTTAGTSSDQGIFVAKYSPAANDWVWAKGWAGQVNGTNDGGVARGVVAAADGSVYVTGAVDGTANIEGVLLTDDGGGFLAKLGASDGHLIWVTSITPDEPMNAVAANALAVDATSAVYVTGGFSGTPSFDGAILAAGDGGSGDASTAVPTTLTTTSGGTDMFLAKYDATGALLWAKHAGGSNPGVARGDDVAFDGTAVYVSGFQQQPTVFDSQTLDTSSNVFVAKYDPSGAIVWAQGTTTPSSSSGEGFAVAAPSATGGVTVAGSYFGSMIVGATTLESAGEDDAFTAQMCN